MIRVVEKDRGLFPAPDDPGGNCRARQQIGERLPEEIEHR